MVGGVMITAPFVQFIIGAVLFVVASCIAPRRGHHLWVGRVAWSLVCLVASFTLMIAAIVQHFVWWINGAVQ